ncbi:MAG TPA: MFS transporter [Sphingobium sp.]|nr:MFS transporter [Sphingobium sp.]
MTASEGPTQRNLLDRLIVAKPGEVGAVATAFLLFFLLFVSYFMLRPVRETFGIAGGVENLQWLWTGTFLAMLLVVPLYGWVTAHMPRRRLLPILYSISALVMAGFATSLLIDPANIWIARAFYIWLSVMNLFVISLAWSLMVDLFDADQSHRLFGQIAAGASLGGLTGPLISGLLVTTLGEAGLLFLSSLLLLATLPCARALLAWRDRAGPRAGAPAPARIGGSIWGGLTLIARSPYLIAISVFILLLTAATTFLYFEQARIVQATFPDRTRQTQVFAAIDVLVQTLTILIQIFFTGRLARRLGVTALLVGVPLLMMAGFGMLALAATFPVLAFVMIVRRVGEYALIRPGREMLFTSVDTETKYKAKNAIDTVVYRGGDALSSWIYTAVATLATIQVAALVGALLAGLWALVGYRIGRHHDDQPAVTARAPS